MDIPYSPLNIYLISNCNLHILSTLISWWSFRWNRLFYKWNRLKTCYTLYHYSSENCRRHIFSWAACCGCARGAGWRICQVWHNLPLPCPSFLSPPLDVSHVAATPPRQSGGAGRSPAISAIYTLNITRVQPTPGIWEPTNKAPSIQTAGIKINSQQLFPT